MDALTALLFLAAAASLGIFADAVSAEATLALMIGIGTAAIMYGGFRLMLIVAERTHVAQYRVAVIAALYLLANGALTVFLIPALRPELSQTILALTFIPIAI